MLEIYILEIIDSVCFLKFYNENRFAVSLDVLCMLAFMGKSFLKDSSILLETESNFSITLLPSPSSFFSTCSMALINV